MKLRKENEARRNRENLATANMTDSYIRKLLKADGILKGIDIKSDHFEINGTGESNGRAVLRHSKAL